MDEDPVFDMEADSTSQREAFAVAAEADKVVGLVVVLHAQDFLLDDQPLIEIFGGVVAGGADEFHAAFEGATVGIGSDKCWQEGMVDIDHPPGKLTTEGLGEDLHEAGEDDEFSPLSPQASGELIESCCFVGGEIYFLESDALAFHGMAGVVVI